jgi:prepilin-type N-terminal cleavage/methylation domain-containing protein
MLKLLIRIPVSDRFGILKQSKKDHGFSLLEILVSLVIVGIIGVSIMALQTSVWKRSTTSNHLLIATQLIEKQIESIRMTIDQNPTSNFPPKDGSLVENGISVSWKVLAAYRPKGATTTELKNVRRCVFTATWGQNKGDTLLVSTYISKLF